MVSEQRAHEIYEQAVELVQRDFPNWEPPEFRIIEGSGAAFYGLESAIKYGDEFLASNTEQEFMFVLFHEIGHSNLGHHEERRAVVEAAVNTEQYLFEEVMESHGYGDAEWFLYSVQVETRRDNECEADQFAAYYTTRYYDQPTRELMEGVFGNEHSSTEVSGPSFHPDSEYRIEAVLDPHLISQFPGNIQFEGETCRATNVAPAPISTGGVDITVQDMDTVKSYSM